MISKEILLARAKELTFSKMWIFHCKNLEDMLSNMVDRIAHDENGFINDFQKCKSVNIRYVMRDVLYLVYEKEINSFKHLIWAPWMETKNIVATRNMKNEEMGLEKEDPETVHARKAEYLDHGDFDTKALGKRDIFELEGHYGTIPYGILMILFTESMEAFDSDKRIPFVKFMQARYKYCQLGYSDFKKMQEDRDLVFESFEKLEKECETLADKANVRDEEIQYIAERLIRLRDKIEECIDYFEMTQSKVELKNIQKIKELIDIHTKDIAKHDGETIYKKKTLKEIQRDLGGFNKKGAFKPMDNERLKNLLSDTKKMWDALAIRLDQTQLPNADQNAQVIRFAEFLAKIKGYFTEEFVRGDWLHTWNVLQHTNLQQ